jgi:hypothetical protein
MAMPREIRPADIQGRGFPAMRCADGTRARGEPPYASAVPQRRFLLLEVPGPWGRSALGESGFDAAFAAKLAAAADASDVRIVLIRRPERHPRTGLDARTGTFAWAVADTSAGVERVRWGSWSDPAGLLDIDLAAPGFGEAPVSGPQRLALVCTNGKRDQCCAIRGRPVAAAIAAAGNWDTWECTHLGGHRFAATVLLLPSGDMFGQLDPESAREALRKFDAGQIMLSHHRGRCGQPVPVQAALHAAAVRLGDSRRGAIRASSARPDGDLWEVEVSRSGDGRDPKTPERAYRVTVGPTPLAAALMSCADAELKSQIRYEALGIVPNP